MDRGVAGRSFEPLEFEYSRRDLILYALGVGCGPEDLMFTYEDHKDGLRALPTFAVVPALPALVAVGRAMGVDLEAILHVEQRIELVASIPTSGRLTTKSRVEGIYDKIRGALVVVETETSDERGHLLFRGRFGAFVRGEGGFGGKRGPIGPRNLPPPRPPDQVVETGTHRGQALLYRLSGDANPLHLDPSVARRAGFERPILHGLCSFGIVGRAVLARFAGDDPRRLADFEARFSGFVYPGETIVTEMWEVGDGRIVARATTRERGELALGSVGATIRR